MLPNPYPALSTVPGPPLHPARCAGLGDTEGQDEKQLWLGAGPAVEVSCDLAAMAELAGTVCSHSAETWTGRHGGSPAQLSRPLAKGDPVASSMLGLGRQDSPFSE